MIELAGNKNAISECGGGGVHVPPSPVKVVPLHRTAQEACWSLLGSEVVDPSPWGISGLFGSGIHSSLPGGAPRMFPSNTRHSSVLLMWKPRTEASLTWLFPLSGRLIISILTIFQSTTDLKSSSSGKGISSQVVRFDDAHIHMQRLEVIYTVMSLLACSK